MTNLHTLRRKTVNVVMLTITGLCTLFAAGTLVYILGYLFVHGATSLSWDFFTKLPTPVGESGGGMANAIVGSGKLLLLASLFGIPIGFLGGVYLAEFGGSTFSYIIRYVTDLLNGVPSIVIGIFAYTLIVLPQKHFSTLAGGLALGVMMIPIAVRSSEEFLRAIPNSLREGAMALGASKSRGDSYRDHSRRQERNHDRHHAEHSARSRRDRTAVIHQFWQSLLELRLGTADLRSAGDDLYLRHRALRRLAQTSVGGRLRFALSGIDHKHNRACDTFE